MKTIYEITWTDGQPNVEKDVKYLVSEHGRGNIIVERKDVPVEDDAFYILDGRGNKELYFVSDFAEMKGQEINYLAAEATQAVGEKGKGSWVKIFKEKGEK